MEKRGSWRIATIRGVEFKLHVSLIILLFYVILVASAQFPLVARQAGLDPAALHGGPAVWGMIFAFALLLSVAIHEFGHVLVAQAHGVQVRGITLMMLGGVSEMEDMPESRYGELRVAVIGPVVSAAIAGALFLLRSLTEIPELVLFTSWLGTVNLVLAIFNMLPAFPLDGGRVLRSILTARQGKLRGTRNAVAISKALAWTFGIIGLLGFNFLLMFIGFFVYTAANSELLLLTTRNLLQGVTVGEVGMKTRVLQPMEFVQEVAEEMFETRHVILPVQTFGTTAAIVRLNSFRRIPRDRWATTRVQDVMEPVAKVLRAGDLISEHLPVLVATPAGALPLSDDSGRLIGLVRSADVFDVIQLRSLRSEEEEKKAA